MEEGRFIQNEVFILLFTILTAIGAIVGLVAWVRKLRRSAVPEMQERIGSIPVVRKDPWANFFGLKSKGGKQIRGNGALALTTSSLIFVMALPRRSVVIPLEKISEVSLVRSHCGKSILRPILRVAFQTDSGPDSAAWALRDPEEWAKMITETLQRNSRWSPAMEET